VKEQQVIRKGYHFGFGIGLALALLVTGVAYGHEHGGHGHGGLLPPQIGAIMQPEQRQKLHALMATKGAALMGLHQQVHAAREKLVDDLIVGNDTTADQAALQQLHSQMLAEKVKLAQQQVATLTPEQRSQAAKFLSQLRALHEQEHQLMDQFKAGQLE